MADVYQIITDRIVSQLENGVVPWHKPWKAGKHGWPKNLVSKRDYRGVNVFLLSCSDYELPYWVSFDTPALMPLALESILIPSFVASI